MAIETRLRKVMHGFLCNGEKSGSGMSQFMRNVLMTLCERSLLIFLLGIIYASIALDWLLLEDWPDDYYVLLAYDPYNPLSYPTL